MGTDPRIIKSKKVLRKSLLKLLQTNRLKDINVKEIAETAGLSRPVFYAHYKSKEDLLCSSLDSVFLEMEGKMDSDQSFQFLLTTFFQIWMNHSSVLKYVFQIQNRDLVFKHMRGSIQTLMEKTNYQRNKEIITEERHPYFLDFAVSGIYNLTKRWVEEGMKLSPKEMGEFSVLLFSGVIQ